MSANRSNPIGVAVVGLGVGEQHARAYARLPECRLRWLLDLDVSRAQKLAVAIGQGESARSYEQVLADPDVGIVSIASYDDAHFEQVRLALNAGKHVFVEKPLCRTLDEARILKAAWSKHSGSVKLTSNLVLRAAPLYRWLKQKLEAGELGELFAIDGEYLYVRIQKITEGWRRGVRDYSVMLGGGVHLVDLILWLTGQRPSHITAAGNRISTMGTAFQYDDFVAATFEFPSGLIGRVTANFGCVHRHQHVLRLYGTEATFLYDDTGARLHISREPKSRPEPVAFAPEPATKGDLIPAFVSAVVNDEPLPETQTMFDVICVCAACDEAVKRRIKVEVQYV
jgi:predicted dehydrogenase